MAEKLVNAIVGAFGGVTAMAFGKELLVFIISLMPILELRGGLIAAALLGLDPIPSYIISIIGNLLPIPFILLFINKILNWMRNSKVKFFNSIVTWLDGKGFNFICWYSFTWYRCLDWNFNSFCFRNG